MNVTDHILTYSASSTVWSLCRSDETPLLPIGLPLDGVEFDASLLLAPCRQQDWSSALALLESHRLQLPWNAPARWRLQLLEATFMLFDGRPDSAWNALQLNLSWRNNCEAVCDRGYLPEMQAADWLVMAAVALANNKPDDAETWASEAVSRVNSSFVPFIGDVLRDTRADVMTVFATVRLAQQKFDDARELLELAHDAHVQAGDLPQMAVDLMLMADIAFQEGNSRAGLELLYEADHIVTRRCDDERHFLANQLNSAINDRLRRYAHSWVLN